MNIVNSALEAARADLGHVPPELLGTRPPQPAGDYFSALWWNPAARPGVYVCVACVAIQLAVRGELPGQGAYYSFSISPGAILAAAAAGKSEIAIAATTHASGIATTDCHDDSTLPSHVPAASVIIGFQASKEMAIAAAEH